MNEINKYIDVCLINEYAFQTEDGFMLDVDSLPEIEKTNFLDVLMKDDTTVRDFVLFQMQKMINERIEHYEVGYKDHVRFDQYSPLECRY